MKTFYLPPLTAIARLMRLHQPTGIWLLLWPCWWGITYATPHFPPYRDLILFAVGSVIMRSCGCIINDVVDRDIDKHVARTRLRPIAAGIIGPGFALTLAALLAGLGLIILLHYNRFTILLGFSSVFLVIAYPFMKRFINWPQLWLGFTFNYGVLMGWSAITGSLSAGTFFLYAAGVFWTLWYDTIYAFQDIADDRKIGVKSSAIQVSRAPRLILGSFGILGILCLMSAGIVLQKTVWFYCFLLLVLLHGVWQFYRLNVTQPEVCLTLFKSNSIIGLLVFLAGLPVS